MVEVFVNGDWKALRVLDDRRYQDPSDRRIHDQFYVRSDAYDADWGRQLPRAGGEEERRAVRSIAVDLKLEDRRNLLGAAPSRPGTE